MDRFLIAPKYLIFYFPHFFIDPLEKTEADIILNTESHFIFKTDGVFHAGKTLSGAGGGQHA